MRPIEVIVPEDSILSAEFPAPTGGYTETILRMIDVIFSAFSKAAPDRVVAPRLWYDQRPFNRGASAKTENLG